MTNLRPNVVKKQQEVAEIATVLKNAKSFIVFEYHGLTAANVFALRNVLHASNSKLFVLKNSISERAFKETNVYEGFEDKLTGPNAVAVAMDDEIAAIKAVNDVAKEFDFVKVKGAFLEGKFADKTKIDQIAAIPGREGLYSMLLSCFTAPLRNVLYGLKAVAEKKES